MCIFPYYILLILIPCQSANRANKLLFFRKICKRYHKQAKDTQILIDKGQEIVNKVQDKAHAVAGKAIPWADACFASLELSF